MEGSSEPEKKVYMSVLSGRPEMQHTQTDSFLTAARLIRRGWPEEGKRTKWQFKNTCTSAGQPSSSRSEENPALNHPQVLIKFSRTPGPRTTEDKETGSEKTTHEAKQINKNVLSAKKPAGQQAGQTNVLYVWASGCRITCRQRKRLKAPVLPAIAEI